MRVGIWLAPVVAGGCATAADPQRTGSHEFAFAISQGRADGSPVLLVTITNRSQRPVCIAAEALQNPFTYEMDVEARDLRGRHLTYSNPGYILEPLRGVVRLNPGTSSRGYYHLSRFRAVTDRRLPRGTSVRVAFRYGDCSRSSACRWDDCTDIWSRQAQSAWVPI
jgi:hypothetical protein